VCVSIRAGGETGKRAFCPPLGSCLGFIVGSDPVHAIHSELKERGAQPSLCAHYRCSILHCSACSLVYCLCTVKYVRHQIHTTFLVVMLRCLSLKFILPASSSSSTRVQCSLYPYTVTRRAVASCKGIASTCKGRAKRVASVTVKPSIVLATPFPNRCNVCLPGLPIATTQGSPPPYPIRPVCL
jgi:hypothetical protein